MLESKRPSLTSLIAFFLIAVPAVYVLAVGPLLALWDAGYIAHGGRLQHSLESLYSPLDWCYDHSKSCQSFLDWYLDLWDADSPD